MQIGKKNGLSLHLLTVLVGITGLCGYYFVVRVGDEGEAAISDIAPHIHATELIRGTCPKSASAIGESSR